jgi:uncharacterized protein
VDNARDAGSTSARYSRGVPEQTAVRDGLFVLGDVPALIGGRCRKCDEVCFPMHEICPYCSHETVESVELSRSGTLWTWTAVNAAPPGYEGPVPYGFGVVELPEGVRIVTRLTEPDPTNLEPGQPMELVLVPLNGENDPKILTYAFAPTSAA